MIHKTRGIVFRFTRYGETSIIVTVLTELFGLQSYMVNGVRSSGAKSRIALYQPLTLLDMVVYHRDTANINRIKELKCPHPFHTIQLDVRKSTIAMFMAEVINKAVRDQSHMAELFAFLYDSIVALDSVREGAENFHLIFLLKLSRFLGFGAFKAIEVVGGRPATSDDETVLTQLLASEYENSIHLNRSQRISALDLLLRFYADHLDSFADIKSVTVLREVLS